MIRTIEAEAIEASPFTGIRELDPRVLAAMAEIPREAFVAADLVEAAYHDNPLPIGHGQTISQPFIVALMTHLARPAASDVVLELGTGSGYQAAVLSRLVREVYSVEVVEALATRAAEQLGSMGYANVHVRCGDGSVGWPEHAPYDSILVTAASPEIPAALVDQLAGGGRLVIPVGRAGRGQDLMLIEKEAGGRCRERSILPVAFVPLIHAA